MRHGLLQRMPHLKPISSAEYPTPAARPKNSVLARERLRKRFGVGLPDWRQRLSACIEEMKQASRFPAHAVILRWLKGSIGRPGKSH